jgi:hypothetical protein
MLQVLADHIVIERVAELKRQIAALSKQLALKPKNVQRPPPHPVSSRKTPGPKELVAASTQKDIDDPLAERSSQSPVEPKEQTDINEESQPEIKSPTEAQIAKPAVISAVEQVAAADNGEQEKLRETSRKRGREEDAAIDQQLQKMKAQKELKVLTQLEESERLDRLYRLLECDNEARYRRKLMGMCAPFHTRDQEPRIPPTDGSHKYRYRTTKTAEEIRRAVDELRLQRRTKQLEFERAKEERYERSCRIMKQLAQRQERVRPPHNPAAVIKSGLGLGSGLGVARAAQEAQGGSERRDGGPSYGELKTRVPREPEDKQKLTWQGLQVLTLKDLSTSAHDLNLAELMGVNDDLEPPVLCKAGNTSPPSKLQPTSTLQPKPKLKPKSKPKLNSNPNSSPQSNLAPIQNVRREGENKQVGEAESPKQPRTSAPQEQYAIAVVKEPKHGYLAELNKPSSQVRQQRTKIFHGCR